MRLLQRRLRLAQGRGGRGRQVPLQAVALRLFPLAKNEKGEWFVRQHGYEGEAWDVFCLDPKASPTLAASTLEEEMKLAERYDAEAATGKI